MTNLIELLAAIKTLKEDAIDEAGLAGLDIDIATSNLEEIIESLLTAE